MLYKIINPVGQNKIVHELATQFPNYFNDIDQSDNNFYGGKTAMIKVLCPTLSRFLLKCGLFDRWTDTGISVIRHDYQMPVHTDSNNPDRKYALNFPVINCQESFIVWYDPIDPSLVQYREYLSGTGTITAQYYDRNNVIEIDKAPSDSIMFVNVKVPHNGINLSKDVRAIISLRFTPELTLEEINHLENIINTH